MPKENIVLIGFGEKSIAEWLEDVKEHPEKIGDLAIACSKDVLHYRMESACSEEQKLAFVNYVQLMKELIDAEEKNNE